MMLIDRAVLGDHERAQTLLREALESYAYIGMPRHIEMTPSPPRQGRPRIAGQPAVQVFVVIRRAKLSLRH